MASTPPSPSAGSQRGATLALVLATVALAVNFWAWNLLAPLAPTYRELLALSALEVSLLVSVPALIGACARIPIGALTDRYGGRVMFTAVTVLTIVPVLLLSVARSYPALLIGGLLVGLGGASFAVGIPFLSAWVAPQRRGLVLGIYGAGNGGTALSGFLSPSIAESLGLRWVYILVAIGLAAVAVIFFLFARNAPGWTPSGGSMTRRFLATLKLPVARDLAFVYAVTFGGFVAFGAYLPTLLNIAYDRPISDAAARAAGFIVLATVARPIGGALSDRYGGARVLLWSLISVGLGAIVTAFEPDFSTATFGFLLLAASLGAGNGAVFALVGQRSPPAQVGSVTGLVGAAGGLGGFMPPIVMGVVYQMTSSYAVGLMLLSNVAFASAVYTAWRLRTP